MTALRSCLLCSASGSAPTVVAIAIWLPSPFPRFVGRAYTPSPQATILQAARDGYRPKVGRRARTTGAALTEFVAAQDLEPCRGGLLGGPARRRHGHRRIAVNIGKQPFEIIDLRRVVDDDV